MTIPMRTPIPDRAEVLTEQRNLRSADLHRLDPLAIVRLMNAENAMVLQALERAAASIAAFVAAIAPGFARGGRLVYLGAGTSGRLGVLDASELPPTFQLPPERVVGIIAGGDAALRRSSEGAEDDPRGALPALEQLRLGPDDAVLGIAAGGTTPYVLGALAVLKDAGPSAPITGLLSCAPVERPVAADHLIVCACGPEVLTGSTRLKAGTATKLALNAISTALMVGEGKVYSNLMVDVRASNHKLRDRAARIVHELTGLDRQASFALLEAAGGALRTAVVMHRLGCDRAAAEQALAAAGGRLDRVLDQPSTGTPKPK